ncbi:MAG: ATP synthase F1 subunit epsilon [Micavibrio aeruginosavorus]|uniref:ATP synthase epsilon chain n=1 Tax=Micavibrio aeruginosavorus TaxID=349221 RepID=A0A2W5A5A0_9BACT|nr:MAG: ATP synthase F1 subunit epsilon [Micavibrio aeruginosavorus]
MNAATFNFQLVSPEKILVSESAWQVVIPGEEGYFGVRAGHMSLVAAVRAGVVEVYAKEGDTPKKIFIAGGFADVTATNCTLLAEQAVAVSELDAAKIEAELTKLTADMNAATDVVERTTLGRKVALTSVKLQAAQAKAA